MTLSTTFDALHPPRAGRSGVLLFNNFGIYHFCLAFFIIDFLDIPDYLDGGLLSDLFKYIYAAIAIFFMAAYFLRWKNFSPSIAQLIFFSLFVLTGMVFAINFFIYDIRQSYISAFISPLVFCVAMFIPPNSVELDGHRITRTLTILFTVGSVFYVIEALAKAYHLVPGLGDLGEVQINKSLTCVVGLCLCILTRRKGLLLFNIAMTLLGLALRPVSTMVLALFCCLPIAIALRVRVSRPSSVGVLTAQSIALIVLLLAVSIPLLLYFYFDDIAPIINSWEGVLKSDVIGGQSNTEFRLAILQIAFSGFSQNSFWYGSALTGGQTVSLALLPGWDWWWHIKGNGAATIHSDFVVMLILAGFVGLAAFGLAFFFALRDRFRELARRALPGNWIVLHSIAIVGIIALIVYSSDQPYMSYYSHAHSAWMLLLMSEVARKAKLPRNAKSEVRLGGPGLHS